jgi:hypothetical protein
MRRLLFALTLAIAAPAVAEPQQADSVETRAHIGPSCFWCSQRVMPKGEEYKWRLMEIGVAVGLLTGLFMARAIKKANAQRAARMALPEARTEIH